MSLQAVYTHDNTSSSRKSRTIETKLTTELNTIVRKIRDNINPLQPVSEIETKFKPLYEQQVYDLIRVAAQETYIIGTEYVNNLPIFKNLQSYLLKEDIQYIQEVSEEYSSRFWGRVALTANRGDNENNRIFGTMISITREGPADPKKTFINPKYIVPQIVTGLIYTTLNQATIRRIRHNAQNINPITVNLTPKNLLQAAVDEGVLGALISTVANAKMIWTTSHDERVDGACRNLEGKTFTIYDQNMPLPPIHIGCRCRLLVMSS